jgi:hypothetical protein
MVFAFIACVAAGALWAQPKVAVLDAVVPAKMDQSVVEPVTEKIIERLVVSGRYTVLDRSNISQVLKEREFQVSGLVSDEEITEAGKYLGADFVVVVKVQQVTDTFFLSSKMIAVKTGVIANQASKEGEGKLSVLIKLAEQVGDVLAGGTVLAPAAAESSSKTADATAQGRARELVTGDSGAKQAAPAKASPEATPAPVKSAAPKPASSNRVGLRLYLGAGGGTQEVTMSTSPELVSTVDLSGGDFYVLWSPWKHWGVVANFSALSGPSTDDYGFDFDYSLSSFDVGLAYALPIGWFMPWVAVKAGTATLEYSGSGLEESADAFEFAFDLGADLRLGSFLLGARYQVQASTFEYEYIDADSVAVSFFFMLGWRF